MELGPGTVLEQIGAEAEPEADVEPIIVATAAVRVRRGHQLRLIVLGPEGRRPVQVRRDEKLITLIAEAHQARQLIMARPEQSLASIARERGRCRTRLGKPIALSCLAPDIVTRIVEGRQPENLSAAKLMDKPLPLSWTEQRPELGFA